MFGDKILFPIFNQDKTVQILYFTKNCATDNDGHEKFLLEKADDKSLIPVPFVEPLLVYGACMRLKGNPQHVRFNYWFSMYKDALANLKSTFATLKNDITETLYPYINNLTGRKPIILPVILDIKRDEK